MMTAPTHYKLLHHYDDLDQDLVIDEITNTLCLKKTLTYFDIHVFEYLKSHTNPHIPKVYDYYEDNGKLIIYEEYIEGQTLGDYLNSNKLTTRRKLKILDSICDGLIFLHSAPKPIIHRDLKMSNIMITSGNEVKIIDYDAAKIYKPGMTRDTELLGTRGSAAPEQYGFGQSDKRTDVYAVGMLIKKLFPRSSHYARIARKATKLDPADRYRNITQLKAALHGKGHTPSWVAPVAIVLIIFILSVIGILGIFFNVYNSASSAARKAISNENVTLTDGSLTEKELQKIIANPDYDADSFEQALNDGKDLTDKIVRFEVVKYAPDSVLGNNIWGGTHLNFISSEPISAHPGDIMVVRICDAQVISKDSDGNRWAISYELLDHQLAP